MKIYKSFSEEVTKDFLNGQLGIIPTDTVYGFAAAATMPQASRRLYDTKRPGSLKPGTLIAANISQLEQLGFDKKQLSEASEYLDLGVSVIIDCPKQLGYLNFNQNSQAVRIIKNSKLNNLLLLTGPLITSSANLPGEITINKIDDAVKLFEKMVDFFVDGGEITNNIPSTIIKINNRKVEILRQGSVKI